MGNTTASLTHEQLFGGGVTIDGAAEIQSELRDRRDKKPSSELNFAPSKAGRVACFDEKRCYITDGELKPLAYFDADAYIAACGISDDGAELFREGVISALEVCIVLTERLVTVCALVLAAQQIVSGYTEIVRHLAEQGEIWLFALGLVAGDRSALLAAEAGKLGLRQIFLLAERDQPFRKLIHTDVPP